MQLIIERFLSNSPEIKKQILNLGGGFDTNYFYFKSKYPLADFTFTEVDFPEIIHKKRNIINQNPQLIKLAMGNKYQHRIIYIHNSIYIFTDFERFNILCFFYAVF